MNLRAGIIASVLLGILPLTGCDSRSDAVHYRTSGLRDVASLDVYVDGRTIHLVLAGPAADAKTLRYTRSDDGGDTWSNPVRVDRAVPYDAHRGNDVQLAAHGDRLVAVWSIAGTGYGGSRPLVSAISRDGGKTWAPGPDPADTDSTEGHGFADLTASGNGDFHLVWLDSRSGEQALYHARSTNGGRHWSRNTPIDAATCECCWNTIKASADGDLFVLYRNVDPRDMALAQTGDGKRWRRLGPVGRFNWDFDGCPHAGGGLAVAPGGELLHAVVWTGHQRSVGLYHLISADGGHQWSQPRRLGDASAQHADVAVLDADGVAAVWDAAGSQGQAIVAALSGDGGRTWAQHYVLQSTTSPSHPRVVATALGWRVFWTERRNGRDVWAMAEL
ncbi:MAG: sialidase family protein [Gammaproteobacteria bacterium]